MVSADLIAVLATAGFVGLFVGTSVLAGRGLGLEQRAGLLERRDPATAAALRRAQSITDFASGGVFGDEGFGAVCTPSRTSWHDMARVRATDSDLRVEVPEETLPPMPATVVFGWCYARWGRTMPLVIAHWIIDIVSFVGYPLAVGWWPGLFAAA